MVEKVLELNKERAMFWTMISALLLSVGFYMYFINTTVHNTVARQNLEAESSSLALSIGNKEFQYISKRNAVTMDLAKSLGYREVKNTHYVAVGQGKVVAVR